MAEPALNIDHVEMLEQPRRLRSLGRIIPWPHQPHTHPSGDAGNPGIRAKVEIRTKFFIDHRRVEQERYEADVFSADTSLQGVMNALTELLAEMEEFRVPRSGDEPVTMDIRLRI